MGRRGQGRCSVVTGTCDARQDTGILLLLCHRQSYLSHAVCSDSVCSQSPLSSWRWPDARLANSPDSRQCSTQADDARSDGSRFSAYILERLVYANVDAVSCEAG